jgi:hypothetical protein
LEVTTPGCAAGAYRRTRARHPWFACPLAVAAKARSAVDHVRSVAWMRLAPCTRQRGLCARCVPREVAYSQSHWHCSLERSSCFWIALPAFCRSWCSSPTIFPRRITYGCVWNMPKISTANTQR